MKTQSIKLPDGMSDSIFEEADRRRALERRLSAVYEKAGYSEVITPALEYSDVFTASGLSESLQELYKFTAGSGELEILRADNTMPMARVAVTKLQREGLPLKLYYNQDIYRVNGDYSGHRNEIRQSGVELIGASGLKSDLVIITLAIEAMKTVGLPFKLEIGHVGYYNALIASLTLDEEEQERIRDLVDSKNTVSLGMHTHDERLERIRRIPLLFGTEEIFAEAQALAEGCTEALEALDYLHRLYGLLAKAGMEQDILLDLGIVHKRDYYTGTVFRGYLKGAGEAVLTGGRYDKLLSKFGCDLPATGFAINVGLASDTLGDAGQNEAKETPDVILHFEADELATALQTKRKLEKAGTLCVLSTCETMAETEAYAQKNHIGTVIRVGKEGETK